MIQFFRKIRQKLLEQNRVSKYLLYAFGEIILVVIGILIALQINNWNENRKQRIAYINILKTIKSDMVQDTMAINQVLNVYNKKEYAFLLSSKDTINKEEYLKCEDCPRLIAGFQPMLLQDKGYKQLLNLASNIDISQDSLTINITSFYAVYNFAIPTAVNTAKERFQEYTRFIRESKPWFKDWTNKNFTSDFYEYVLHDPIHKNRIADYYGIIYNYYLRDLKETKRIEKEILKAIEEKLILEK